MPQWVQEKRHLLSLSAKQLKVIDVVKSPTFSIVNEYISEIKSEKYIISTSIVWTDRQVRQYDIGCGVLF